MTAILASTAAFVTRPQAPVSSVRPAAPAQTKDTAPASPALPSTPVAPVREPDRVELSRGAGAVEPVEPVEAPEAGGELTEDERAQVEELKARDAEVKTHEQAHVAAAGPHYRGGPTYSYQRGPDGNRYAVGGSVQIDTSPVAGDPGATIAKAQQVRRAALAPAEPSSADLQVAARASRMEAQAQRELAEERATGTDDADTAAPTDGERDMSVTDAGEAKNAKGQTEGGALDVFG